MASSQGDTPPLASLLAKVLYAGTFRGSGSGADPSHEV